MNEQVSLFGVVRDGDVDLKCDVGVVGGSEISCGVWVYVSMRNEFE